MSDRGDNSGTSTPGTAAATRPDSTASSTRPGSTDKSVSRRTWDFSSMTPGSPFRRLNTPARRSWKTSPGPTASQRMSVLSSSISTYNPSSHHTTRSMPLQPTETDDIVSWINSMKLKAQTIIHSEVEEERKFYEKLERDKRLVQAHHEVDSEAFEKLKVILEGKMQPDTRSEYHTEYENEDDPYGDEASDRDYIDGEAEDYAEAYTDENEQSEGDLYALRPEAIREVPGVIELSDDDDDDESGEANYDPQIFRDESVPYEVTPQYGSMYSSRHSLQQESAVVVIGDSESEEDYDGHSQEHDRDDYDRYEEDYSEEGHEVGLHQYDQDRDTNEESDEEDRLDEHEVEEVQDYDSEIEYVGKDHEPLEQDAYDVALQSTSHTLKSMDDLEDIDEVNLLASGNFELLASAALGDLGTEDAHEDQDGDDSDENQHHEDDADVYVLSESEEKESDNEEVEDAEIMGNISDPFTHTHEIAERAEPVASGQPERPDSFSGESNASESSPDPQEDLDQRDQVGNEDREQAHTSEEISEEGSKDEFEEQHIYYDSDNEAYGSPSHSMFGTIKEEDLSVWNSDDNQPEGEQVNVDVLLQDQDRNDPKDVPEKDNQNIQHKPDVSDDEEKTEWENEYHSFVSFFDQGPLKPEAEGLSFADSSQQFLDSLQSTRLDYSWKRQTPEHVITSADKESTREKVLLDDVEQVVSHQQKPMNPEVETLATKSILRTTIDAANELGERSFGETPGEFMEDIEEGIKEGIRESTPLLSSVLESAVSSVREMEENALGETVNEFTKSVEEGITDGVNEIGSSVSSAVNSFLKSTEEYENETLGETAEEFIESMKEGLYDVHESVERAASAAETFSSSIAGLEDAQQEDAISEARDEIIEQATGIASQMFETALGESGFDLVTAIDGQADDFADETTATSPLRDNDLLREGEDENLTTGMVTAHENENSISEETSQEFELFASTPLKTTKNRERQLPPSKLRNSIAADDLEHNPEISTPLSHAIGYIGDSMHSLVDSVDDWVSAPVDETPNNAALSDEDEEDEGNTLKETHTGTTKALMDDASNPSASATAIGTEASSAPENTEIDYVQDEINTAVSRTTRTIVDEVSEVSRAASTWFEEAFTAPDDSMQQKEQDGGIITDGKDISTYQEEQDSESIPTPATNESTNATNGKKEQLAEEFQKPSSLLKRGWSTLMGWTTSKRVKNDFKRYDVISRTEPLDDSESTQVNDEGPKTDERIVETQNETKDELALEDTEEPVNEALDDQPALNELTPPYSELDTAITGEPDLTSGIEGVHLNAATERETRRIAGCSFSQNQTDHTLPESTSKKDEPTGIPKKHGNRISDLGQPEHIVMKTRSGRILGANTEEELKLAKLREEEEQRQLSEIVEGGANVPPLLRELAITNQFVESQVITTGHLPADFKDTTTGQDLKSPVEGEKVEPLAEIETDSINDPSKDSSVGSQGTQLNPLAAIEFEESSTETASKEKSDAADAADVETVPGLEALVKENKKARSSRKKTTESSAIDNTDITGSEPTLRRSTRARKKQIIEEGETEIEAANVETKTEAHTEDEVETEPENTDETARGRGRRRKAQSDVNEGRVTKPASTSVPAASKSRTRRAVSTNSKSKTRKRTTK